MLAAGIPDHRMCIRSDELERAKSGKFFLKMRGLLPSTMAPIAPVPCAYVCHTKLKDGVISVILLHVPVKQRRLYNCVLRWPALYYGAVETLPFIVFSSLLRPIVCSTSAGQSYLQCGAGQPANYPHWLSIAAQSVAFSSNLDFISGRS